MQEIGLEARPGPEIQQGLMQRQSLGQGLGVPV